MKQPTKGEQTKSEILERVNAFFNKQGVDHTIAEIAEHIGMGKSRITNYFPRKELLVISLLRQHEQHLDALVSKYQPGEKMYDFGNFIPFLSDVMELMFRYRGVIAYSMINTGIDDEILLHIKRNYARNKKRIRKRLEKFDQNGLIIPELLDPEPFEEYFFQYACMSSNWIISHNLLNPEKNLEKIKLRYMRSILCCLKPYLTEKGRENLENALNEATQGQTSG
jgi:AcrR family transcriptional regulator